MRFKEFYLSEGRNKWMLYNIRKGKLRWSFRNTETNKLNFIRINPQNEIGSMQEFLKDIQATPGTTPKTQGKIDFSTFAGDVIVGSVPSVYVKSGMVAKIQDTWLI